MSYINEQEANISRVETPRTLRSFPRSEKSPFYVSQKSERSVVRSERAPTYVTQLEREEPCCVPSHNSSPRSVPRSERSAPRTERSAPRTERSVVQSQRSGVQSPRTPRTERSVVQSQRSAPRTERSVVQSQRSGAQSKRSAPRTERSVAQSQRSAPQEEGCGTGPCYYCKGKNCVCANEKCLRFDDTEEQVEMSNPRDGMNGFPMPRGPLTSNACDQCPEDVKNDRIDYIMKDFYVNQCPEISWDPVEGDEDFEDAPEVLQKKVQHLLLHPQFYKRRYKPGVLGAIGRADDPTVIQSRFVRQPLYHKMAMDHGFGKQPSSPFGKSSPNNTNGSSPHNRRVQWSDMDSSDCDDCDAWSLLLEDGEQVAQVAGSESEKSCGRRDSDNSWFEQSEYAYNPRREICTAPLAERMNYKNHSHMQMPDFVQNTYPRGF